MPAFSLQEISLAFSPMSLALFAKYPTSPLHPTSLLLALESGDSRELLLLLFKCSKMAAPEVHHLFHHPVADHSFSTDRQTLAVARDINVELYHRSGNKYTLQDELKGHDKTVTSVDIAPSTGRIVTCSQGQFKFRSRIS